MITHSLYTYFVLNFGDLAADAFIPWYDLLFLIDSVRPPETDPSWQELCREVALLSWPSHTYDRLIFFSWRMVSWWVIGAYRHKALTYLTPH
jgi:hypothetical protein